MITDNGWFLLYIYIYIYTCIFQNLWTWYSQWVVCVIYIIYLYISESVDSVQLMGGLCYIYYISVYFRICGLGTANGWFLRMQSRVHLDQVIETFAQNCSKLERLEIQWDPDSIRFSDKSSKFIDHLR